MNSHGGMGVCRKSIFFEDFTRRHGVHRGHRGKNKILSYQIYSYTPRLDCKLHFSYLLQEGNLRPTGLVGNSLFRRVLRVLCARGEPSPYRLGWKFAVRTSFSLSSRLLCKRGDFALRARLEILRVTLARKSPLPPLFPRPAILTTSPYYDNLSL
jgi:hypothetical protein